MADKEATPSEVEVDTTEKKERKLPVDLGGMGDNVKNVTGMVMDAEKRKQFMTSEDMEPHRMLAILIGLTIVITVIVALAANYMG